MAGIWHTTGIETALAGGTRRRPPSVFQDWITNDGEGPFPAQSRRYHLYDLSGRSLSRARPASRDPGRRRGREKDIRYSSRTRRSTDEGRRILALQAAFRRLEKKLPDDIRKDPDAMLLGASAREVSIAIMQLIYARKPYEGSAKDYEFSRATMREHWAAGKSDAERGLRNPGWTGLGRKPGIVTFDPAREADVTPMAQQPA